MMIRLLAPLMILTAAAAQAETPRHADIRGSWVLQPYIWRIQPVRGCWYEQWLQVGRRIAPGRYTGRVRYRTTCGARVAGSGTDRVTVTRTGDRVRIIGTSPTWIPEIVRIVSPVRMEGKDRFGHPLTYDRRKAPPTAGIDGAQGRG